MGSKQAIRQAAESIVTAQSRVQAHEFGELTASELIGKITNPNAHPDDAAGCVADVLAIARGDKGPDTLKAFTQGLTAFMAGDVGPDLKPHSAQILDLRANLRTERDGRLYAIAMLEAMEDEEANPEGGSPHGSLTENESPQLRAVPPRTVNIYRAAPQSPTLRTWIEQALRFGSPAAINGFYVVLTEFFSTSVEGMCHDSQSLSAMEKRGELEPWGTVNYRDPEAARAALAKGESDYVPRLELTQKKKRKA